MNIPRDWNNTYRIKGPVQNVILPTVVRGLKTLQRHGCRSVLDLCCGTGRHTAYLAKNGLSVHGIDVSFSAIEITRDKAKREELNNVTLGVGDMRAIELPESSIDAVLCVWSLGHGYRDDLIQSISEMFRILKPGGLLLCDFPSICDQNFGQGIEIAPKTYLHPFLDHPDVPHYYCDRKELETLLMPYVQEMRIEEIDYDDPKYQTVIKAFWVEALKKDS